MLYSAFVQQNIDYGLIVWGSAIPSAIKLIQTSIKKKVRKMLFKKSKHPTEPLFTGCFFFLYFNATGTRTIVKKTFSKRQTITNRVKGFGSFL